MKSFILFCALSLAATSTAAALSPDLARSCRNAALQAYPYQLPGTGPGNAQNEIRYYRDCLAKGGKIDTKGPPAPATSSPGPPAPTGATSH